MRVCVSLWPGEAECVRAIGSPLQLTEEDQKKYIKFNLLVTDRWQTEMIGERFSLCKLLHCRSDWFLVGTLRKSHMIPSRWCF